MSDVTETLQDLMERRLKELGKRRGRGESISLREAYQRLLDEWDQEVTGREELGLVEGAPPPTYEVFRRIRNGHTRITDTTASALATMLDVDVDQVYAAAKIKPRLSRFELPTRADRLDEKQRKVVLDVVDAILGTAAPASRPLEAVPGRYDEALDALPDERDDRRPIRGRSTGVAARKAKGDT